MLGWCWVVTPGGRRLSSCSLLLGSHQITNHISHQPLQLSASLLGRRAVTRLLGWPSGLFHGREMLSAFFLEPDVLQLVSLSLQLGSYLL